MLLDKNTNKMARSREVEVIALHTWLGMVVCKQGGYILCEVPERERESK